MINRFTKYFCHFTCFTVLQEMPLVRGIFAHPTLQLKALALEPFLVTLPITDKMRDNQ